MLNQFKTKTPRKVIIGAALDTPAAIRFLETAIHEIEDKWVETEGIYRLSAQVTRMRELRGSLDKNLSLDLTPLSPHEVCGLVKMLFKNQPEPIFTFDLYESFVAGIQELDEKVRLLAIGDLLKLLPPMHFKVLMMLISHLHFVAEHKKTNKMAAENLAIVFGPVLLRPRELDPETILADVTHVNEVIMTLIRFEDVFFEEGGEHEDKVHIQVEENSDDPANKGKKAKKSGLLDDWWDKTKKMRKERRPSTNNKKKHKKPSGDHEEDVKEKEAAERALRKKQLRENLRKEKQSRMLKKGDLFKTAEDLKSKYHVKKGDSVIRKKVAYIPPAPPPPPPGYMGPIQDYPEREKENRQEVMMRTLSKRASRIRKGKYTVQELSGWLEEFKEM